MSYSCRFSTWEPIYEAILADLGFDRSADETARDIAAEMAHPFDHDRLADLDGATVAVVGAAPSLSAELASFEPASVDAIVAASTAVDVLADHGLSVDLMVTDLDKNVETARELTHDGTPVAAHAHGDNIPTLREWLPQFDPEWTLVTTQAEPRDPIENVGGFTDGDRAAFICDAFGAAELRFLGWNFDDPSVDPLKARKLRWAEQLLYWLEGRRGERFAILDGRRESLADDPSTFSTN
ncbi:MAG: 6-hydroxymethylpterin diphosphokinase MptE-like protein [Euryarchaeota archaeon]|nr:6-hydroxymethylpterin diphosphokinase MptE-like protein [Euryarchaeota archaeon]